MLGIAYDEERYNEVTYAASLLPDFAILPNGDQTVIGDKGVTLSGGQRARVGLARGLYVKAELYLLDDPLAAVDSEVAKVIYERAVQGFLKDKARILITHQHQFLNDADKILYLDNGEQIASGSYEEIMSVDSEFIRSLQKPDEDDDDGEKNEKKTVERKEHKEADSNEMEKEKRSTGGVGFGDILFYLRASGSDLFVFAWIFSQLTMHGLTVFYEIKLSTFAATGDLLATNCSLLSNDVTSITLPSVSCQEEQKDIKILVDDFIWYASVFVGTYLIGSLAHLLLFNLMVKSGRNLHDISLAGLINAPMRFFSVNPPGRIINRFSQGKALFRYETCFDSCFTDLGRIDSMFPFTLNDTVDITLTLIGSFSISIWANWFSAIIAVPMICMLIWLRSYYLRTAREVKRLDSILRSPIYNHISSTMNGRLSIRAFKLGFVQKNCHLC